MSTFRDCQTFNFEQKDHPSSASIWVEFLWAKADSPSDFGSLIYSKEEEFSRKLHRIYCSLIICSEFMFRKFLSRAHSEPFSIFNYLHPLGGLDAGFTLFNFNTNLLRDFFPLSSSPKIIRNFYLWDELDGFFKHKQSKNFPWSCDRSSFLVLRSGTGLPAVNYSLQWRENKATNPFDVSKKTVWIEWAFLAPGQQSKSETNPLGHQSCKMNGETRSYHPSVPSYRLVVVVNPS